MKTAIVTGSAGLVGSEAARFYAQREFRVAGIDNDMRSKFFGTGASTKDTSHVLESLPNYQHHDCDIRDENQLRVLFDRCRDIAAVIHTAAQPSHDWAAENPRLDFAINATGTLSLLEWTRQRAPKAAFIFTSTNKVYGDRPNCTLGHWREEETRWELKDFDYETESWWADEGRGFAEEMPIDHCTHSLFGASKLAADILVQEYGRYFGMNTVAFRCGCLTGPAHAGAKQHGFLSYLVRCCMLGEPYTVIGYKGKQVRDNLHAADLVNAFDAYLRNPKPGAVYNMGGGRENSCSVREAIALVERISGKKMQVSYDDKARVGDHQWWITDTSKFRQDYPAWRVERGLEQIVAEMVEAYR